MSYGNRRFRRMAAAAIVTAGVLSLVATVPASAARDVEDACTEDIPEDGFTDTGDDDSAIESAVDCIAAYEVTSGTSATTYSPSDSVSRAQMATFLMQKLDLVTDFERPADAPDAFTDDTGSVHEDNINDAAELGVTAGTGGTNFDPSGDVSRAQMASFIVNQLEAAGVDIPADSPDAFGDDDTSVHEDNINILGDDDGFDIADGTAAGTYSPSNDVTRGQMAFFLTRDIDLLVEEGLVEPFGGPGANQDLTDAPELLSVEVVNVNTTRALLRMTFDETIEASFPVDRMWIYPPDTSLGAFGFAPDEVERDPADDHSALGSWLLSDLVAAETSWDEITVIGLDEGAVTDLEGMTNPEGDFPIKAVTIAGTTTIGSDLMSVGDFNTVNDTAVFVFDEAIAAIGDVTGFNLVLLDGTVLTSTDADIIAPNLNAVLVDFTDAGPPIVDITPTTVGNIRRGAVNVGAGVTDAQGNVTPTQTADVAGGVTNGPDLVSVTFDKNLDRVDYVFDEPVEDCAFAMFGIFDRYGTEFYGTACSQPNTTTVRVQFPAGAAGVVTNITQGAFVLPGGADSTADTDPNAVDHVGIPQPFEAGFTAGPELLDVVIAVLTEDNITGEPLSFSVTFVFDELVDGLSTGGFSLYQQDGTEADASGACVISTVNVVCTAGPGGAGNFTFDEAEDAVVGAIDNDVVSTIDAYSELGNVESNEPVTRAA